MRMTASCFRVRVLNTGEVRIVRDHRFTLAGRPLKFPCFADPDHPDDDRRWLHAGWAAQAISRICEKEWLQPEFSRAGLRRTEPLHCLARLS
jgi:hypothetical protein